MNLLEKNLALLRKTSPAFAEMISQASCEAECSPAKIQGFHLQFRGKSLNSRIDPVKEAQRITEKEDFSKRSLLILGGMELGYQLQALMKKYPQLPVLVVEKQTSILKAAFSVTDFEPLFTSGRLEILVPETPQMLFEFLKSRTARKIGMIFHRPSFDLEPEFYREVKETAERYVSTQEINLATLARFEKLWFKNMLLNLPAYLLTQGVATLFDAFQNRPVFLIGAGPSLQKQIPLLKTLQNHYTLLAVNTSLPYLLENDIVPHFVITVDPQDKVYRYFLPVIRKKLSRIPVLIAEPTICPKIVKNYPGTVLFCQVGFLQNWILSFSSQKGELDMGGSVITAAFSLARQMGASPIVFLGTDMSYTEKALHFRGAELEKEWLYTQTVTDPLEGKNYFFLKKTKLFPHEGFNGETVYTDMRFATYINWLEKNFRLFPELNVINATEGGIRFQWIRQASLKEVVKEYPSISALPLSNRSYSNPDSYRQYQQFLGILENMEHDLPRLQKLAGRGAEVSRNLLRQNKNDQKLSSTLFKELNQIDQKLTSFSLSEILSLSLQKIIQEVHDSEEENSSTDPAESALRQSLKLYEAIEESASYDLTQVKKARQYGMNLFQRKSSIKH